MDDLISRQAAIDTIMGQPPEPHYPSWYAAQIEKLPAAQPQRMRGKWAYGEDEYGIDGYHCDKCGFFVSWDYAHMFINYIEDYNFCPYCGAEINQK